MDKWNETKSWLKDNPDASAAQVLDIMDYFEHCDEQHSHTRKPPKPVLVFGRRLYNNPAEWIEVTEYTRAAYLGKMLILLPHPEQDLRAAERILVETD